jgi:hypothetical protein
MSWTYDSWRGQASPSITSWTDTITADVTKQREVHVTELRTALDKEVTDRGLASPTWEDNPLVVNITKIRAVHINNLRSYSEDAYEAPCNTDSATNPAWTDKEATPVMGNRVEATTTKVRKIHIDELRSYINVLEAQCLCDCHSYCCNCHGHCGCNCNSHCSCEGHAVW